MVPEGWRFGGCFVNSRMFSLDERGRRRFFHFFPFFAFVVFCTKKTTLRELTNKRHGPARGHSRARARCTPHVATSRRRGQGEAARFGGASPSRRMKECDAAFVFFFFPPLFQHPSISIFPLALTPRLPSPLAHALRLRTCTFRLYLKLYRHENRFCRLLPRECRRPTRRPNFLQQLPRRP